MMLTDLVSFSMQVLSVNTALSIQSHPDKALAERLHAERPQASMHNLNPWSLRNRIAYGQASKALHLDPHSARAELHSISLLIVRPHQD